MTPAPYGPNNPPPPERPAPTRIAGPGITSGKADRWPWWLVPGALAAVAISVFLQREATRLFCR